MGGRKPLPPRRLRMDRKRRLQSAPKFLREYRGKHIVRGYARWYGVDRRCAMIELQILGVRLDPNYVAAVAERYRNQQERAMRERQLHSELEDVENSDNHDDIPF